MERESLFCPAVLALSLSLSVENELSARAREEEGGREPLVGLRLLPLQSPVERRKEEEAGPGWRPLFLAADVRPRLEERPPPFQLRAGTTSLLSGALTAREVRRRFAAKKVPLA